MPHRRIVIAGCLGAIALAFPAVAAAHAFLVNSSPQAGERLPASPRLLTLQFTEQVAFLQSDHLSVETATKRPVTIGTIGLAAGGAELFAALPRLTNGIYMVNWAVVSSDDGHPSAGQFAFAVGSGGRLPELPASTSAPTDWWDAVAEWLLLLGLAVSGGGLASTLVIWQPLGRDRSRKVPTLPVKGFLVIAFAAASTLFVRYVGSLHVVGAADVLDPNIVTQAVATRAGLLSLAACALIFYALLTSFIPLWRYSTLLALILAALAAALRSHPAATTSWWGAPAIAIHLVLAILWSGALIQLVLVFGGSAPKMPREVILAGARRYAWFAVWSAIVVLLSGLAAALAEFTSVSQLVTTGYGLVLIGKAVLVLLALILAFVARTDALRRPLTTALRLLRGLTRAEAGLLVTVLAASALLSNVAPPFVAPAVRASPANSLLGPPPPRGPAIYLAGKAGWLEVYLTASRDQLVLRVVTPDEGAATSAHLRLSAKRPEPKGSIDLFPRSCGAGCYSMHFRWSVGTTRLSLEVRTARWSGGTLTFDVPWPPGRRDPILLRQVIASMRAQPRITVREQTSSAPNLTFTHVFPLSGKTFVASEPYTSRVADAQVLRSSGSQTRMVLYLPGSDIWVSLWIDGHHRLRREVIVDPGHLIVRTFSYPRRR